MASGLKKEYVRSVDSGDGDGSYYEQVRPPNAILVLEEEGRDAICGCPYCLCGKCAAKAIQVKKLTALPPALRGIATLDEMNEFIDKLNKVLMETYFSVLPFVLFHFVVPFSPFCCYCYFSRKRNRLYQAVLDEWNEQHKYRNVYFDSAALYAQGFDMAYLLSTSPANGSASASAPSIAMGQVVSMEMQNRNL